MESNKQLKETDINYDIKNLVVHPSTIKMFQNQNKFLW